MPKICNIGIIGVSNPASDFITLKSTEKSNAKVEIYNMLNQQMIIDDISISENETVIGVKQMANGIYFLKQGLNYKPFIIKH